MREDTKVETHRMRLLNDFYTCNFDVTKHVTQGHAEKCVDISLAVEMLFMATVPDAYDIAGMYISIYYVYFTRPSTNILTYILCTPTSP